MPELIIILVIALIVIGPKKLPDLAKALGKGLSEFKRATTEIKDGLNLDEDFKEAREDLADAVSGLDKPSDLKKKEAAVEDVVEKEKPPKFDDYDQMLDAYHQEREKPSKDTKITTASQEFEENTIAPKTVEKDRNG